MQEVRAYPYELLPRYSRRDIARLRSLSRWLPPDGLEPLSMALGRLLGAPCSLDRGLPASLSAGDLDASLFDPLVAVVLIGKEPGRRGLCLLEIEPRFALVLVDRVLGGEGGTAVPNPSSPLTLAERGVLGYVLARALAESFERPPRVATVLTAAEAARTLLRPMGAGPRDEASSDPQPDRTGQLVVWPGEARVGEDRGAIRALFAEEALFQPAPARAPRAEWLGPLEILMVAELGVTRLAASELERLALGDVILLDECSVEPAGAGFDGEARVRADGSHRCRLLCSIEGDRLTLRRIDATLEPARGKGMRMGDRTQEAILERAGDAPIEVSVEVGRFTIALEELARMKPGDVMATGCRLGEPVVLRAGQRALGLGELVDVEGEVGVRVLRLSDDLNNKA